MNPSDDRRLCAVDWLLLLLCAFPLFLNLGKVQVWGSEGRWLMVTDGMRQSGDYFFPRLDEEFYGDKPVLGYWSMAAAAWFRGELDEAAGRWPSALAGLTSILLTAWIGAKLFDRRTGLLAGMLLASSYSFFVWSRTASSDLLEVGLITAAIAVYAASKTGLRAWHAFAFFALLALGGQAKGMPGILVPAAVALTDAFLSKRRDLLARKGLLLMGALAGASLYFLPFLVSWLQRGDWELLRLMWKENFLRAFDAFDHKDEPFYYYLWVFPLMMFPWTLWLPGAVAWSWKRWKLDEAFRFALAALLVILLLFSASQSRRSYYILPIFPWAALLLAAFWLRLAEAKNRNGKLSLAWKILGILPSWLMGCASVAFGLALCLLPVLPGNLESFAAEIAGRWVLGAFLMLAPVGIFWVHRRRASEWALFAQAGVGVIVCYGLATMGQSVRSGFLTEKPLVAVVQERYPNEDVYYCGFDRENFEFYAKTENDFTKSDELVVLLEQRRAKGQSNGLLVVCVPGAFEKIRVDPRIQSEILYRAQTKPVGEWVKAKEQYLLVRFR